MGSNLLGNGCILNGFTGGYVTASNPVLVPESLNWIFEYVAFLLSGGHLIVSFRILHA